MFGNTPSPRNFQNSKGFNRSQLTNVQKNLNNQYQIMVQDDKSPLKTNQKLLPDLQQQQKKLSQTKPNSPIGGGSQSEFSKHIKQTVNQKLVNQIMMSFDQEEKRNALSQKLMNKTQLRQPKLPILTEKEQIQADQLFKRKLEEYTEDFIQKRILQNKRIQKVMEETSNQIERIIIQDLNSGENSRNNRNQKLMKSQIGFNNQESRMLSNDDQIKINMSFDLNDKINDGVNLKKMVSVKHGQSFHRKDTIKNPSQLLSQLEESFYRQVYNHSPVRGSSPQKIENFNIARENFTKINSIIDHLQPTQDIQEQEQNEYNEALQSQEETKQLVKNHGKKLRNLLEKWCESDDYKNALDDPRLDKYRYETWGELIDFEQKLQEEMMKFRTNTEKIKYLCYNKVDSIKYTASAYIESLEQALNENKLQQMQKIERLQMAIEEHESRAFNVLDDNDFMKSALEAVLEKLHKDYVKMVSQSKTLFDDLSQFKDQNEKLTKELSDQKGITANLIDILSNVCKIIVLYKDDEVSKICRKTIDACDIKQKEKLPSLVNQFIAFMRMYPVQDLVTPARKEIEQLKQMLYVIIDYLNNTGQIIKFWIPQFEDTDEQYRTTIEGWHKNYLVTVFENETLQFMQRFRPPNLDLPNKFATPQHVTDRIKQQKQREQIQLEAELLLNDADFTSRDQLKSNDGKSQTFLTDKQSQNDLADEKSQRSQRGLNQSNLNSSQVTLPTNANNLQSSNQKDLSARNHINKQSSNVTQNPKEKEGKSKGDKEQGVKKQNSKKKNKNSSKNSNPNNLGPNSNNLEPSSNKKKLTRENSKTNIDISQVVGKDKSLKSPSSPVQMYLTQIKFPLDIIYRLCENVHQKLDSNILDKITMNYKNKRAEQEKLNKKIEENLTEQEQKFYQQIISNQPKNTQFIDASNLIKILNEVSSSYFDECIQKQYNDPENQKSLPDLFRLLSCISFKEKGFCIKHDKAIEFLASPKADGYTICQLFKIIIRLNTFFIIDKPLNMELDSSFEAYRQQVIDQFFAPNSIQIRILFKMNKIRDFFNEKFEKDNSIGEDYFKFNPSKLKTTDIYEILNLPFYKEGINEISIIQALSTYTANLKNLNNRDNFDLACDLVKYKFSEPNKIFDEYNKKTQKLNLPLQPSSLLSEGMQQALGNGDNTPQEFQHNFIRALRNINQHIQTQNKNSGIGNQNLTDELIQSEIVNLLSHRSSYTNMLDQNKSVFSSSDLGGQPGIGNNKAYQGIDPLNYKEKELTKVEIIRQETIKTIKVLQDFVKKSVTKPNRATIKQRQSSLIKLNSLQSFTEQMNLQQEHSNISPLKGRNNSGRKKRNSTHSLTIEESSERSSTDQMEVLIRYTNGQKSTHSKISQNRSKMSKHSKMSKFDNNDRSITDNSKSLNKSYVGNITPISKVVSNPSQYLKNNNSYKNESPNKRVEIQSDKVDPMKGAEKRLSLKIQVQQREKSRDIERPKGSKNENRGNKSVKNDDKSSKDEDEEQVEEDDEFKDFQTQKEKELFGAAKKQLRELDNTLYIKRMKKFDEEIEKLRSIFKQNQGQVNSTLLIPKNRKLRNSQKNPLASPNDLFKANIIELNHRMTQIENSQRSKKPRMTVGPQINFINTNINVDNSFIPDIFVRKIENSSFMTQKHAGKRDLSFANPINQNTKLFEKNLKDARNRIVGSQQSKEQRMIRIFGQFSQPNSPSPSPQTNQHISFDNQDPHDQTARFTFKQQNTTLYGNVSTTNSVIIPEGLKQKYLKREPQTEKHNLSHNQNLDLPIVDEK